MSTKFSTLLENSDGFSKHYKCAMELFLLSMLSQSFYVIVDHGVIVPVQGRELLYSINSTLKRFIFQFISTVQFPSEKGYYTQIVMYSATYTKDCSLDQEFQKHLSNAERKHVVIDQVKCKNGKVNKSGRIGGIIFRRKMMLSQNILRCFYIQTSFHSCHFVVHAKNYIVS